MSASVKNIVTNFKNIGTSLINANNYDETTQFKSISQGAEFNKYIQSIKNDTIEGFAGKNNKSALIEKSQSVLSATQISDKQQQKLERLTSEYLTKQTRYNNLLNTTTNNSNKIKELTKLETRLDSLSQQINDLNETINQNITNVNAQISTNSMSRIKYMNDIAKNKADEDEMDNVSKNIQNMLNDSDIRTLQKNYSYILFSILAAGSILVAMNIMKND
jgi:chorismate mutase